MRLFAVVIAAVTVGAWWSAFRRHLGPV